MIEGVRPATLDDVDRLASFMGRCTLAHLGVRRDSAGEMRQRLTKPGTDLALDTWIVEREGAEVAAFAQTWSAHPLTEVVLYVRVDPQCTGQGIATDLLARGAERAQTLAAPGKVGRRVLHATSWPKDELAAPLLEEHGFAPVRYFLLMTIELEKPPVPSRWPSDIQVQPLDGNSDLRPVYEAQRVMFQDHWGESRPDFEDWLHEYTGAGGFDPTLWFVAEDPQGIAGLALCLPESGEDADSGYVGDLAVRADRRGAGLGLALLVYTFSTFFERGKRRVSLHVDTENLTGALRLYTRAGMQAEQRIVVWEREL